MNRDVYKYFSSILLPDRLRNFVFNEDNVAIERISSLTKLNLFVGTNNSGKSLLLREILKTAEYKSEINIELKNEINETLSKFVTGFHKYLDEKKYSRLVNQSVEVFGEDSINKFDLKIGDLPVSEFQNKLRSIYTQTFALTPMRESIPHGSMMTLGNFSTERRIKHSEYLRPFKVWIDGLYENYKISFELNKLYSPTIRSLRKYENSNFITNKTIGEYEFPEQIKIENGQNMYESILNMMTDEYDVRKRKFKFEEFLSQEFFNNKKIELNSNTKLQALTIKIGDEKERPIYDIGEGFQMIIILTFPLFFYKNGIYVIEEPEIYLHPGLQHKLLNTFIKNEFTKDLIFLISTHSNHILDSVNYYEPVSVFSMSKFLSSEANENKEAKFSLENLAENKNDLLSTLGVRNTSVFLSNTTIWVEGVTDMLYLRKFMAKYLSQLNKEDENYNYTSFSEGIHYSFILSSGSNIVHYDFSDENTIQNLESKVIVKRICGKAFVIVDKDGGKNSERKKKFFEDLKGRFYILDCKEIENILSNDVIVKTINSYPTCTDLAIPVSNYRSYSQRKNQGIGYYIENHLMEGVESSSRKIFNKPPLKTTSTINDKLGFCHKSLDHIEYENMTTSAVELTKSIFEFINDNN